MPNPYPSNPLMRQPSGGSQSPPGMTSPALDALQQLGSASPSSGFRPNPHRFTESDNWTIQMPQTPPSEVSGLQQILNSLRMASPQEQQTSGPQMRREKPSYDVGNRQ